MDFFNGEHMKQLRYDMLQPGEPSELIKRTCIKCITNETNSGNSKRLQNYYTTNLDKENIFNLVRAIPKDMSIRKIVTYINHSVVLTTKTGIFIP